MADKILRPITDVEIVEQMTENDTVLIEHGGEIKRAKGVAGGSGGGLDDIFIVHVEAAIDAENGTVMIATDKTFEETWEVVNRAFEAQEAPTGTPKLIFMHFMDKWVECSGYMTSGGVKAVKFASPFSLQGADDGAYKGIATHLAWREDGTINSYTVEIPDEYCKFDSAVPVNVPMQM